MQQENVYTLFRTGLAGAAPIIGVERSMLTTQCRPDRFCLRCLSAAVLTLLVCTSSVAAERLTDSTPAVTPWTHQNHLDDPNEFQFAVVSDNAANPREGVFQAALAKLQLLRPKFVLSIGDFIHGYNANRKPLTNENVVRERRQAFDELLRTLTLRFYRVPGNHDINNDLSARIWKGSYGPTYYSFVYRDVLFLCLNSQDGPNYGAGIGAEQIAWVKDTLAANSDSRWSCLFLHQPLWLEDEKRLQRAKNEDGATKLTGFHEIEKLLSGRPYTVFAGHHHRYGKWIRDGHKYFRLATTGGQSALQGPQAGQFDHIMWVTMTDNGPIICNLLLEGILDEDAKTNMPGKPAPGK